LLAWRGRIVLGKSIGLWLDEALADPGPHHRSSESANRGRKLRSTRRISSRPADRLIVATARVANAILMTRDHRILDYAARGHLTAIPA
jgi:PIN domain nuclease of toxin-antitoxin system